MRSPMCLPATVATSGAKASTDIYGRSRRWERPVVVSVNFAFGSRARVAVTELNAVKPGFDSVTPLRLLPIASVPPAATICFRTSLAQRRSSYQGHGHRVELRRTQEIARQREVLSLLLGATRDLAALSAERGDRHQAADLLAQTALSPRASTAGPFPFLPSSAGSDF